MKKRYMVIGLLISFSVFTGAAGCGGKQMASYQKISPEKAKYMMEHEVVQIVDVRHEEEYREGHIPGAVLVTNETIGDTLPEELPDKKAVLLVYCRSGVRSKQASQKLVRLGYENVYDFGGIINWPYEIEKY